MVDLAITLIHAHAKLLIYPLNILPSLFFICCHIQCEEDELWEVVCEGCHQRCEGCNFWEAVVVPQCISISDAGIEHASSGGGVTTIEELFIHEGYWRATANSTNVLECYSRDACRGGVTGTAGFCGEGYQGACE